MADGGIIPDQDMSPNGEIQEINGRKVEWIKVEGTPGLMVKGIPFPEEIKGEFGIPESVKSFDYVTFALSESIRDYSPQSFGSSLDLDKFKFFSPAQNFVYDKTDERFYFLAHRSLRNGGVELFSKELAAKNADNFLLVDGHGWNGRIGEQTVRGVLIKDVLDKFDNGDYPVIWMANCQNPEVPIEGNKHATVIHPVGPAEIGNPDTRTKMVRPPSVIVSA